MQMFRTMRIFLLALLVSVTATAMHAQFSIGISVGFAPPMLPVYVQPVCPEPNLMWTPGYWAYSNDIGDYFWVPGAWVPAPYEGALWTPPYWGWSGGNYGFHDGYWGPTVGYYGGVNYGFGFGGIGFSGGEWRGGTFAYNAAITHVDVTVIHTTYVNQTIVASGTVSNPNHVAYNGGPNGIQHAATPAEKVAANQPHVAATSLQTQHAEAARADKTSFAKANGGRPANLVAAKPLAEEKQAPPAGARAQIAPAEKAVPKAQAQQHAAPAPHVAAPAATKPEQGQIASAAPKPEVQSRPALAAHAVPATHASPVQRPAPAQHAAPAPKAAPKEESRER
jgi:hypothetical protein